MPVSQHDASSDQAIRSGLAQQSSREMAEGGLVENTRVDKNCDGSSFSAKSGRRASASAASFQPPFSCDVITYAEFRHSSRDKNSSGSGKLAIYRQDDNAPLRFQEYTFDLGYV